jgi:threonine dehydratase
MRSLTPSPVRDAASGHEYPHWALPSLADITRAAEIVGRTMPPTPQYGWPLLNARAGVEVWVKHENHTPVGAFKIRGALVYMDWLAREHPVVKSVICATRGNFGHAVSLAARQYGLAATIVVPRGNSPDQNRAIAALGAELVEHGEDFQAASEYMASLAEERGAHPIPSFHELLVHGTGTYALEFLRGAPEMDTVYVPIGLGSSICGMMAVRDALGLRTKIVGVVSAGAPAYALSFREKRSVSHAVTTLLSDGLACRKPVLKALKFILSGVDHIVEVTDDEGAGAAALAGLLQERRDGVLKPEAGRVGIVLTGSNVNRDVFGEILHGKWKSE